MSIPINAMVWVIDCIRTESLTGRRIVIAIAITVIATVGQYIFGYFANRFAWISTFYAIGDARERALQHVQSLPIGTVAGRDSGDISTALTSDFDSVGQFAHGAMPTMFGAIALPLCVFLSMVFIDPPLAVAVLVSVAFAVPLFMWANRIFKKLGAERADLFAGAN